MTDSEDTTPVTTAIPLMEENIRNSLTIFPSTEILNNGEFQTDVGEALSTYQQYLEKLRTH